MNELESATYFAEQYNTSLDDYPVWIDRGIELASLGEVGRALFHKISSSSSKYDYQVTDDKFTSLLKKHDGRRSIKSFFHYCIHELGIKAQATGIKPNTANGQSKPVIKIQEVEELKSYSLDDILEHEAEPRMWKFIMAGTLNAIAGSSDVGKSTLIRNFIKALVTRSPQFMGWELDSRRNRVIYVSTEDGFNQQKIGFKDILSNAEYNKDAIAFIFDSSNIIKNIKKLLSENIYGIIIIDTWGDLVAGNYESTIAREVMRELGNICIEHEIPVWLSHHTTKAGDNIPHKNSIKGTSDFEQKVRCAIMLTTHRGAVWISAVKGNDLAQEEKDTSYKTGYDESRREITITNEVEFRSNLIAEARRDIQTTNEIKVDWKEVMVEAPLKYKIIVERLEEIGLSERGAKGKIKKAFEYGYIEKDSNGLYSVSKY